MIRDPSDGSVREKPVVGIPATKPTCQESLQVQSALAPAKDSAKLIASRKWLKDYHKRGG